MFRTRFNVDKFEVNGVSFSQPTMTQQQFKEDCDVNTIIRRYSTTGVLDSIGSNNPEDALFGDFTGVMDFQDAQNMIIDAQERFMELPSGVRKRFNNNPAILIDFLNDSANREEAVKLGLVNASVAAAAPDVDLSGAGVVADLAGKANS